MRKHLANFLVNTLKYNGKKKPDKERFEKKKKPRDDRYKKKNKTKNKKKNQNKTTSTIATKINYKMLEERMAILCYEK